MEVTLWLAFGAGVLSFLSPCTLPLYPVFLSYITGVSVSDLKSEGLRQRTAWFHTFSFLFGVFLAGLWQPRFMMREKKLAFGERKSGYFGTVLIGIGFAAGWTPCTGPILAGVIALAASNPSQGMGYMLAYVIGFAIPFLVMAGFVGKIKYLARNSAKVAKFGGYLMMAFGVVLYFDGMNRFAAWMSELVGFTGF